MRDVFKGILIILLALVLVIGLGFLGSAVNLWHFQVFAPKMEQARRTTFEQSKAYRQGLCQELESMQYQYIQASPEHKAALASIILRRVADVPDDALTPSLRDFIDELRHPSR